MLHPRNRSMLRIVATAVTTAVLLFSAPAITAQTPAGEIPRLPDGTPDLNGFWQTLNTAYWNLETQAGGPAPPEGLMLGAIAAIPPGLGVVQGGEIPYQAWAREKRNDNRENWTELDTELNCFLPGVPRVTYLPHPFQILQYKDRVLIIYQYSYARRDIRMTEPTEEFPIEQWLGWSYGRWEGDTLVVDVSGFLPASDLRPNEPPLGNWLDRSGNFYSEGLHVVERYTPIDATHIMYEATIEDPNVFTRPWTISMPLYRRLEPNMRILEFKCAEYIEEMNWGEYRRQPEN